MSSILSEYIGKRVKVVYKDGTDDEGNPKIKTLVAEFLRMDESMAQFELEEGSSTAIALTDIVRVTEKSKK